MTEINRNTLTNGYIPVIREFQGVYQLLNGVNSLVLYGIAPVTNEKLSDIGKANINNGLTNLLYSPIIWFSLGFYAKSYLDSFLNRINDKE
jgi:hypothetical protein